MDGRTLSIHPFINDNIHFWGLIFFIQKNGIEDEDCGLGLRMRIEDEDW
jgi:hypothetical protein